MFSYPNTNPITTLGDIPYGGVSGIPTRLPGNIGSDAKFLTSFGDGLEASAPSWQPAPTLGVLVYYWTTTTSDVGGCYKETSEPQVTLTNITTVGVTNGQLLATWITEPSNPNRTSLPAGQYSKHIHAEVTSGTKTVQLRAEVWECDSSGVDIVKIADVGNSTVLTGSKAEYSISQDILQITLASSTSRLKNKIYAVVGTSGSAPTVVLYTGDGSDSRMNLPAPIIDASNYAPYVGATKDIDTGTFAVKSASIYVSDFLVVNSTQTSGVKVDETTPTYAWSDLKGTYVVDTSGAAAPTVETMATGISRLGFNGSDICRTEFHIEHRDVAGGIKYLHPHVMLATGATAATTNLVLSHVVRHSYGSIGTGETRGASPAPITVTQTITVAQVNAIGSGNNKAFDIEFANSGGTGGKLNSANFLPDDLIDVTTTVTSLPTITGGTSTKVSLTPIDIHREVRDLSGTKNKDRTGGSFYGTT